MYAVYHVDTKYGHDILLKICHSLDDAKLHLQQQYGHRLCKDRDLARILDATGAVVIEWEVDWMAQFEAVKSWNFRSSSDPKRVYETRLTVQGFLSCNCRGWTFKKKDTARWCTHTNQVIEQEGYVVKVRGQYQFIDDGKLTAAKNKFKAAGKTQQQKFMILVEEYEIAIGKMAMLDPKDMMSMLEEVALCKFKVEAYMSMIEEHGAEGLTRLEAAQAKLGEAMSF